MNEDLKALEALTFEHNFIAAGAALKVKEQQAGALGFLTIENGVEVGVRHGIFSEYLIQQFPVLHMLLIDPYEPYLDVADYYYNSEEQEKLKADALIRMQQYPGRYTFQYLRSAEAALKARKDKKAFDFVFIDAIHEYSAVRDDLNAWAPLVLKGGLLMGHDLDMAAVGTAVREWAAKHSKEVYHIPYPADVWIVEM